MSNTHLSRGDRRAIWAACALIWTVPISAYFATTAKADPITNYAAANASRVCAVLDTYPTFAGLEGVFDGIVEETNLNYYGAGRVVGMSVAAVCPWHQDLIDDFVAVYLPTTTTSVGGGIHA